MNNIQTSTIRVPKNVLEDIKIYCRKAGQPVGEWVEKAWRFLQKNNFDIYDTEATPFYQFRLKWKESATKWMRFAN